LLGSRIVFLVLFVVSLVAWNLQRNLQESTDWAEKNENASEKVSFGRMMANALKNPVNVKTIVFLVAVYLTWNLAAGTNGQFMPYLYKAAGNIDATGQSLLGIVQWVLVAACSLLIFAKLGDKVPHRVLFGVGAAMALVSWIAIAVFGLALDNGTTDSMGWCLWAYVILWGISAGFSAQCFYALWSTELFPTQYRGGAEGIMFFLVRGALGIWSLVGVGAIMGDLTTDPSGFFPAAVIMCVVLLISLVVGVVWCPQTQGKTLDEITRERYGDSI
jgi:inositol transporter-like SP family MFS transporter